jgi:hypothetical protein
MPKHEIPITMAAAGEGACLVIPRPEQEPTVSLWPVAGQAIGLQRSATFHARKAGRLPFPVLECGGKLRVPTAALRRVLRLDEGSLATADPYGESTAEAS